MSKYVATKYIQSDDDAISRDAAINLVNEYQRAFVIVELETLPTAEPKRPKGELITTPYPDSDEVIDMAIEALLNNLRAFAEEDDDPVINYKCPFCETGFSYVKCAQARPNFCMNCGADMRGDKE